MTWFEGVNIATPNLDSAMILMAANGGGIFVHYHSLSTQWDDGQEGAESISSILDAVAGPKTRIVWGHPSTWPTCI